MAICHVDKSDLLVMGLLETRHATAAPSRFSIIRIKRPPIDYIPRTKLAFAYEDHLSRPLLRSSADETVHFGIEDTFET